MYYIMCATGRDNLFTTKQTPLSAVKAEWGDATVLVCERETGYGKSTPCLVVGAVSDYEQEPCTRPYTQDTGWGHKNRGKDLRILNSIRIINSEIVSQWNDIGLDERRSVWVMK